MDELTIKVVGYTERLSEIKLIRVQVFQIEQGVAAELEFDGKDEIAKHLLAYWNNQPVGTSRVRSIDDNTAKIERLAVLSNARGKGIGKQLMIKALELAEQAGIKVVVVHAQEYVKGLYQKLGFEVVGDSFEEAGIVHVKMVKQLIGLS
ncbi:GNAT family N-acetyltransferase [Moorena sp. SIO3H5]|uniref:GNAT family N-acetyltransferase n=1 Tax=Moorena sp. SIO3H5 TaxID=2607834 RepID=UPI0013BBCC3B|nr:GNAT family N-acetyltransferase [Moorena sp. SIO3H5]NEO69064.1 GNAT family N-acetyltransferase [Moorena sp. SIO3H5]